MPTSTLEESDRDRRFQAVLLPLLKAVENGEPIDRLQAAAEHPEFAGELEEYFAARGLFERLVAPPPAAAAFIGGPGAVLGDFRLLREVGRGGMGVVYEARQISLDRRVALKVLPFAAEFDSRQLQRFKNEAHAAALLQHPHIVPVHAVGCEGGVHFYAMQFIDGASVADIIRARRSAGADPEAARSPDSTGSGRRGDPTVAIPSRRPPPPVDPLSPPEPTLLSSARPVRTLFGSERFREIARLGSQAADALEHAHRLGVIHRDVKPANLLVDPSGKLWVADFGVALLQRAEGMTSTGELVGTLRYMSPEQASGDRGLIDHRADVYSLGATLYELLTLLPPFPAREPAQLLRQIEEEEPRPPRQIDAAIPSDLETIVLKTLAKSADERYLTAADLADDLRRFLADQPVRAARPGLADRAAKWARRHRNAVLFAAALLLLVTVGSLVAALLVGRAHYVATTALADLKVKTEEAESERERAETNLSHARRVLDYLVRFSAEELSERPELIEARQKILASALQYYRQLAAEPGPKSRTVFDEERAAIERLLDVLKAQEDFAELSGQLLLVTESAVQNDLKLTSEQIDGLTALREAVEHEKRDAFKLTFDPSDAARAAAARKLAAERKRQLVGALGEIPGRRLKQIALQQRGLSAFAEPEIAAALRLTAEQKLRIRELLDNLRRDRKEALTSIRDPGEADGKANRYLEDARDRLFGLLTAQQATDWSVLVGKPFKGRSFGAPGPEFDPFDDLRPKGAPRGKRPPPGGLPPPGMHEPRDGRGPPPEFEGGPGRRPPPPRKKGRPEWDDRPPEGR
ncbi:MAG TPA: serine/threonine-protein kinase [Planctomycetia bacterium]|nr:serine/threonine-protein kinase [Planctomycetia bacterium]